MLDQAISDREDAFAKVYSMITEAQSKAWQQINKTLIELYWDIGQYVSDRVATNSWGKSIVEEMSKYIVSRNPSVTGFSARNIWRMKQFYETYQGNEKLSAVLTEIAWSNHLHIMSKTKSDDEKQFYLELAAKNRYSERDFARIIDSSTYERTKLADLKLSAALTEFPIPTKGRLRIATFLNFLVYLTTTKKMICGVHWFHI